MSGLIETIQTYEPSILEAFSFVATREEDHTERTGWYSIVDSYEVRCKKSSKEDQQILMKRLHEALQSTYDGTCEAQQTSVPVEELTLAHSDKNMTDAPIRYKIYEIQRWYLLTIGDDWEECKADFKSCLSLPNPDNNLHKKKGQPRKGDFWQDWGSYLRDKEARRVEVWESWRVLNEHRSLAARDNRSLRAFENEMTVAHDEDKIHVVHLWYEKTIGHDWDGCRAGFKNMLAGGFSSVKRGILSDVAHLFYCLHMLNPDQKDEGEFWNKCEEYVRKSNLDSEGSDREADQE